MKRCYYYTCKDIGPPTVEHVRENIITETRDRYGLTDLHMKMRWDMTIRLSSPMKWCVIAWWHYDETQFCEHKSQDQAPKILVGCLLDLIRLNLCLENDWIVGIKDLILLNRGVQYCFSLYGRHGSCGCRDFTHWIHVIFTSVIIGKCTFFVFINNRTNV